MVVAFSDRKPDRMALTARPMWQTRASLRGGADVIATWGSVIGREAAEALAAHVGIGGDDPVNVERFTANNGGSRYRIRSRGGR